MGRYVVYGTVDVVGRRPHCFVYCDELDIGVVVRGYYGEEINTELINDLVAIDLDKVRGHYETYKEEYRLYFDSFDSVAILFGCGCYRNWVFRYTDLMSGLEGRYPHYYFSFIIKEP